MNGATSASSLYTVAHIELDWERLEKCPALGPVKISTEQIGHKFSMAPCKVYSLFLLLLGLVMLPNRNASRKEGDWYNSLCSWKTRLKFCSHHGSNADLSGGSIFFVFVELYLKSCWVVTLFVPVSQATCKTMLCHAYNLALKRRRLQRGQNTLEGSPLSEPSLSVCLLIS